MLDRTDLHKYQLNAVSYVKKTKKCALFLDMGLGKTTTSLTVAGDFLKEKIVNRVLIVAPLRVANTVWKQECEKWLHLKKLNIGICTGTPAARKKALTSGHDIIVINRENIPWLVRIDTDFDMTIVDESSSFKNHATKRFKALRQITSKCQSVVLLSGTPSPNGHQDLWAQMYLLDDGARLGKNITEFRRRYCTDVGYGYSDYVVNARSREVITAAIADICVSMTSDDYLSLPPRIDIIESVILDNNAEELYREMKRDYVIKVGDSIFEAVNAAVAANKLLQLSNGAVYGEDGQYSIVHNEKIDALKDIVDNSPNENLLVAYNFKSDLERIQLAFPDAILLSKSGVELPPWNNGSIKMLLAHPASAGHGLNAQWGGSTVIWFGLNWSLGLYEQFNARLHRQGQTKPVKIIHILARDTIDEKVLAVLKTKGATQKDIIDSLRYD